MPDTDDEPADLTTPIQPTGFGVADLEIAREQEALAEDEQGLTDDTDARLPDLEDAGDDAEGHPS